MAKNLDYHLLLLKKPLKRQHHAMLSRHTARYDQYVRHSEKLLLVT